MSCLRPATARHSAAAQAALRIRRVAARGRARGPIRRAPRGWDANARSRRPAPARGAPGRRPRLGHR
eukprot:4188919-Lingulodinium_polyedra.AAC.1